MGHTYHYTESVHCPTCSVNGVCTMDISRLWVDMFRGGNIIDNYFAWKQQLPLGAGEPVRISEI